jgi:hypothetical protein
LETNNGKRKNSNNNGSFWDRIADLTSGRLHNRIKLLGTQYKGLKGLLQEIKIIMTNNERALLNAADQINTFANNNESALAEMRDAATGIASKIERLTQQAQSSEPVAEPEDLSQELDVFNAALGRLSQTNMALTSTAGVFRDMAGNQTVNDPAGSPVVPIHTIPPGHTDPTIPVGEPGTEYACSGDR